LGVVFPNFKRTSAKPVRGLYPKKRKTPFPPNTGKRKKKTFSGWWGKSNYAPWGETPKKEEECWIAEKKKRKKRGPLSSENPSRMGKGKGLQGGKNPGAGGTPYLKKKKGERLSEGREKRGQSMTRHKTGRPDSILPTEKKTGFLLVGTRGKRKRETFISRKKNRAPRTFSLYGLKKKGKTNLPGEGGGGGAPPTKKWLLLFPPEGHKPKKGEVQTARGEGGLPRKGTDLRGGKKTSKKFGVCLPPRGKKISFWGEQLHPAGKNKRRLLQKEKFLFKLPVGEIEGFPQGGRKVGRQKKSTHCFPPL